MPEQINEVPFWEKSAGVSVPTPLKEAAREGRINETEYNEAVGLVGEANLPRGIRGKVMEEERVARLRELLKGAGIEDQEVEEIFSLLDNI